MKHTRVVSTKCTPGFACRAFSDTTLVCFIVNEHTTKCSRYRNIHQFREIDLLRNCPFVWTIWGMQSAMILLKMHWSCSLRSRLVWIQQYKHQKYPGNVTPVFGYDHGLSEYDINIRLNKEITQCPHLLSQDNWWWKRQMCKITLIPHNLTTCLHFTKIMLSERISSNIISVFLQI